MEKQRCSNCNKKLKLINYPCNCNNTFCVKCRHPEDHNCTFDFKSNGKKQLEKDLIKVAPNKVIKI